MFTSIMDRIEKISQQHLPPHPWLTIWMTPGKIYSFLQFMWYEKNNLVVRTWILDFSRSIYDEIDIIPWILRLIICCLANNRNLPRARVGGSKSSVSFYGLFGLILDELEQLDDHRQRSQQIYSSKHRWRASKKNLKKYFFCETMKSV